MRLASSIATVLLGGWIAASCLCCTLPIPPIPVPPSPGPVDPTPPPSPIPPPGAVSRGLFDGIAVGMTADTIPSLPEPAYAATLADGTWIRGWTLDESRPGGGWVAWEVHVRAGIVRFTGAV